jgi:ELWxxDGT repeat protein
MKIFGIVLSAIALSVSLRQSSGSVTTVKTTETWEEIPTASLTFDGFTKLNDKAIFAGSTIETGAEPWVTNGTPRGTTLLLDIIPGPRGSNAQGFIRYENEVCFYADDGIHGMEVWRTDGTLKGTKLLKDLVPGAEGMRPIGLSVADHRLYIPVNADKGGPLTFYVFTLDITRTVPGK